MNGFPSPSGRIRLMLALFLSALTVAGAAITSTALGDDPTGTTDGGDGNGLVNDSPPSLPGHACVNSSQDLDINGANWTFKTYNSKKRLQTTHGSKWFAAYWPGTSRTGVCQQVRWVASAITSTFESGTVTTGTIAKPVQIRQAGTTLSCARVYTVKAASGNSPLIMCTGDLPDSDRHAVVSLCPAIDNPASGVHKILGVHCQPTSYALVPGTACGQLSSTAWSYYVGSRVYARGNRWNAHALITSRTGSACSIAQTVTNSASRGMLSHPTDVVHVVHLPTGFSSIRCQIDRTVVATNARLNECDAVLASGTRARVFFWLAIDHPSTGAATPVKMWIADGETGPGFGTGSTGTTTTTTTTTSTTTTPSSGATVVISGGCPTNTASNPLPADSTVTLTGTITPADPNGNVYLQEQTPSGTSSVAHEFTHGSTSWKLGVQPGEAVGTPGSVVPVTLSARSLGSDSAPACPMFYAIANSD